MSGDGGSGVWNVHLLGPTRGGGGLDKGRGGGVSYTNNLPPILPLLQPARATAHVLYCIGTAKKDGSKRDPKVQRHKIAVHTPVLGQSHDVRV